MANTDNDRLAKHLKFSTLENRFGFSKVRASVEDNFLNGVDIAHGGFLFSLADFASALATNTNELVAVASNANINYLVPCKAGVALIATASLSFTNEKTALCDVKIESEDGKQLFAIFQSRVIFKR